LESHWGRGAESVGFNIECPVSERASQSLVHYCIAGVAAFAQQAPIMLAAVVPASRSGKLANSGYGAFTFEHAALLESLVYFHHEERAAPTIDVSIDLYQRSRAGGR